MKRRAFIAGLGAAAAWPLAARAQQQPVPVIGNLVGGSGDPAVQRALRVGLAEMGFVEGRNIAIETRFGNNQYDRLPGLVADLIDHKVVVINTTGSTPAVAAKAATSTIPIVFNMGEDPASIGLVSSFNRPGGNITGIALLNSAVLAKRLELLHQLVPQATVLGAFVNPDNPNGPISTKDMQDAASRLGLQIHILDVRSDHEIDAAFAKLAELKAGALLIAPDGVFIGAANQIAVLAARYGLPASHEFPVFPAAGGLMSYGGSIVDGERQAGIYVARILKGEKPGDLPVVQPTKFDFVINLKTARALGVVVPETLLTAATEVIE